MLGMVLAAGAGRRLRPYTDTLPKALVPVDDETTILDLTLSNFSKVGLKDVAVIVGYKSEAVEDRKKDLESRHGVNLELIFNDKAEEWNNAYSLWCARDLFSQGFLLANGDTVHPVGVQETLLANRGPAILLAVDTVKKLADLLSSDQVFLPPRKIDLPATQSTTQRAKDLLGWEASISLETGMKALLDS